VTTDVVGGSGENVEMEEKSSPIKHPEPTRATVRELYATAFRCGFKGCRRPLYRMNDETGEFTLNSHVSHICTRSSDGPRWDPSMSAEENRSVRNLMLMCFEHAYEIDAAHERFPVELLHEWKAAQLADRAAMQRTWELTEDQADEVIQASFRPDDYGVAVASAASVADAARTVGSLAATARRLRRLPQEAAQAWQLMRQEFQESMPRAWDSQTGELLPHFEPPRMQTQPFEGRMIEALGQVVAELEPLVVQLVAELHAVRAITSRLAPWCQWIEDAANDVVAASGRWPGNPPDDDDEELSEALDKLSRASAALNAAWRGQPAEEPPMPLPPPPESVESDLERSFREHRELLKQAHPWGRVKTLPFEPVLYASLLESTQFALGLPDFISFLADGLDAVTGLAADIARNATDDELQQLIDDATKLRLLAIAVLLLRNLAGAAKETGRPALESEANRHAIDMLLSADWTGREIWVENRFQARRLLGFTASVSSESEVSEHISNAIANNPALLEPILLGACSHIEERDSQDWSNVIGLRMSLAEPPFWFPTTAIAAEIRRQFPDLRSGDRSGADQMTEVQSLALQVLEAEDAARS
jgi:hypothetical protein